jgi:hypothetical protein
MAMAVSINGSTTRAARRSRRSGLRCAATESQTDAVLPVPNQLDEVNSFGGGIGYLGRSLRLGFNADMIRRVSVDPSREYERRTYGGSVTYEF